jgi:serine/threonine-protein kinase
MSGHDETIAGSLPTIAGAPALPELVASRYRIVRWLGGGGMGSVYEVFDTELEERVALKVLRSGLTDDAVERFRREVRLTRRIQHPNVARMFDIGDQAGDRFLTMELIDGEPLTRELGPPMSWDRLRGLTLQLCAGLAAAHARGVVHRDLKPDNVLIERGTDRLVITDFGIARSAEDASVTLAGTIVGTPRYMAPEQLAGTDIDARADLFSLGVMLFELATGTRPWAGESPIAIAVAHATEPARRLSSSSAPPALADLVARCLAIDRADRPATANEIAQAIAAIDTDAPPPTFAAAPTMPTDTVAPAPPETSVVVLRFELAAGDEYLADGLRDDLIDTLSVTAGLRVHPAGATGTHGDLDPRGLGAELGVAHVVSGTLRRTPTGLRISARLLGVADGFQIWANRIECAESEVLAVSAQLAQAIAGALSTRVVHQPRPTDPRAVDLYLRARAELRRFWGVHAQAAAELLAQAAAISPDSPSIASQHACAMVQAWVKQDDPTLLPEARRTVERALALGHPEAFLASSMLRTNCGDTEGGAEHLAVALARAPMSPLAHELAGRLLAELEEGPAARHHLDTAMALDPYRRELMSIDVARIEALAGARDSANRRIAQLLTDPDHAIRQLGAIFEARLGVWFRDLAQLDRAVDAMAGFVKQATTGMLPLIQAWRAGRELDLAGWTQYIAQAADPLPPRRLQLVRLQRAIEVGILIEQPELGLGALRLASDLGLLDFIWLDRCPLFTEVVREPRWRAVRDEIATRAARVLAALRGDAAQVLRS